jgi:Fuc2NAc and GlcNAc transferase
LFDVFIASFGLLALFIASAIFTEVVRKLAVKNNILDKPNNRSAHTVPTPRLGGVAFILVFKFGLFFLFFLELADTWTVLGLFLGGGIVSLVGYFDDKSSIVIPVRLVTQFLAVAVALYCFGKYYSYASISDNTLIATLISITAVLYLLWLINLYNFMDGIDGIAGLQAVSVLGGLIVIQWFSFGSLDWAAIILVVSVSGFLVWNFPKARIFMGDVGSGFLGLVLGLFSLHLASINLILFLVFMILMAVFVTDTSITLVRRFFIREKIYKAHNTHAYQNAARKFNSHAKVSTTVFIYNLFWLFPLSMATSEGCLNWMVGFSLAYIPTIITVIYFRAGQADENKNSFATIS